jgi:hypothetical protein
MESQKKSEITDFLYISLKTESPFDTSLMFITGTAKQVI